MPIEKLYKVGEVMAYTGLSRQQVHNYTQLGLINPVKRTASGHRLYDEHVFGQIDRIKKLRADNRTLLEIKEIFSSHLF